MSEKGNCSWKSVYDDRLDYACQQAGARDAGWNERYKDALRFYGLQIVSGLPGQFLDEENYPGGMPSMAPIALPGEHGWPRESVIVWDM